MKGWFITFEGVEGSGKSTVAGVVEGLMKKAGMEVILTREPGGTGISEIIRGILLDPGRREISPLTELFLYLASRAQLVNELIEPALGEGKIVLCDRFMDATVAYQGWARGLGEDWTERLNAFAVGETLPDMTFLLDLPVEEGFKRGPERREGAGVRSPDRMEKEDLVFHRKVREGYLRIADRNGERVVVVDASRSLKEVVDEISGNLQSRFNVNLIEG
jgi:dTMP kinase